MLEPPPAAPLAETAGRTADPEHRSTAVAVGRDAASAIDEELVRAVAEQWIHLEPAVVTDRDAVELVQVGKAPFACIGGRLSTRDREHGLLETQLGVELFALAVAPGSAVRSLTPQQARSVLTGEVRHWSQLGHAGGDITMLLPEDGALAARAARTLIAGDSFAASGQRVSESQVDEKLTAEPGAIAVVRVTTSGGAGRNLLQVDWQPPTMAAFDRGLYPFGVPLTLVTPGHPVGAAADFVVFARSPRGRALLGRTLLAH